MNEINQAKSYMDERMLDSNLGFEIYVFFVDHLYVLITIHDKQNKMHVF
jgi:hypothetical protein